MDFRAIQGPDFLATWIYDILMVVYFEISWCGKSTHAIRFGKVSESQAHLLKEFSLGDFNLVFF